MRVIYLANGVGQLVFGELPGPKSDLVPCKKGHPHWHTPGNRPFCTAAPEINEQYPLFPASPEKG